MSGSSGGASSIRRNALFALASQGATGIFTAAITVYLVRALDPAGYGVFALALGFAGVIAFPSDFGISLSAARFIAERRGKPAEIAAVLARALGVKLVLTSSVVVALIVLAQPIADLYDEPDLAWPLRIVAIALLGQALVFLFANVFVAMGRVAWQFVLILAEAATEATATIGLVLLAGSATAAATGRAVGYTVGALLGAAFVLRLLGRRAVAERRGGPPLRQLASYAGTLLVVDGAYAIFAHAGLLLVGGILGATAAGVYGAPLKLASVFGFLGLSLAQAIAPRLARHPDEPPRVEALLDGIRLLVIVQGAVTAIVVIWAEPIVELILGAQYQGSVEVLRALGLFIFLTGLGPLVSATLNFLGEARRRVPIAIGCAALNIALAVALIEEIGITGAAWSFGISYGIYVAGHIWLCRTLLGLRVRPLVLTAARTALAAAALGGVLILIGTADLSPLEWISGLVLGLVAFAAVLVLTREISGVEVRALVGYVRRG